VLLLRTILAQFTKQLNQRIKAKHFDRESSKRKQISMGA